VAESIWGFVELAIWELSRRGLSKKPKKGRRIHAHRAFLRIYLRICAIGGARYSATDVYVLTERGWKMLNNAPQRLAFIHSLHAQHFPF
jgi:hypothetical protein